MTEVMTFADAAMRSDPGKRKLPLGNGFSIAGRATAFTASTVKFPDGEDVAGHEPIEQALQFGPTPAPAGDTFLVDALTAGGFEGLDLGGGVLVFGLGHAGVAEQRGRCCFCLLRLS